MPYHIEYDKASWIVLLRIDFFSNIAAIVIEKLCEFSEQ